MVARAAFHRAPTFADPGAAVPLPSRASSSVTASRLPFAIAAAVQDLGEQPFVILAEGHVTSVSRLVCIIHRRVVMRSRR